MHPELEDWLLARLGPETVPCQICDTPTRMTGTKLCDGCWEVTHRIEYFLAFPKGKAFVLNLLGLTERASAGTERAAEPIPHNSDFDGRFQ